MSMQPYNNIGTPLGGPVDDMMDDEEEVLSKESPQAKAARLAAEAEKERKAADADIAPGQQPE